MSNKDQFQIRYNAETDKFMAVSLYNGEICGLLPVEPGDGYALLFIYPTEDTEYWELSNLMYGKDDKGAPSDFDKNPEFFGTLVTYRNSLLAIHVTKVALRNNLFNLLLNGKDQLEKPWRHICGFIED